MLFKGKEYFLYLFRCFFSLFQSNSFIKKFKQDVLASKTNLPSIEKLRSFYKNSHQKIAQEDYGAGSKTIKNDKFLISNKLYNKVAISRKYGQVLYHLASFYKAKNILELGTSLGISAAYLSKNASITTIEGNKELAQFTEASLQKYNFENIQIITAKFDDVLKDLLKKNTYQIVFIDGNHTQEATLRYFTTCLKYRKDKLVLVFDDIYWSKGMKIAWQEIKNHKDINLSVDLFKFGIVFLDNSIEKQKNVSVWL